MARDDPKGSRGRDKPADAQDTSGAPRDAGQPPRRTRRGTRAPTAAVGEATVSEPAEPITVTGPRVPTSVMFTPPGRVRLRINGSNANDPTELDGDVVAVLFAAGLQMPEPDRTGWVSIGELDIDDQVGFLVGSTGIDRDTAMQAVCRGLERALVEGLARLRDQSHGAPGSQGSQ